MTYTPRPCELDDDPTEWHVVKVTQQRVECADGCDGPEPHMNERREWRYSLPRSPLQQSPPSCLLCGSMTTDHVCPVRPGSKP